jgi:hypothetical protein
MTQVIFKSAEQAIQEGNSTVNQDIKSKFVGREIYCNVNSLVEYCLNQGFEDPNSPINMDELENYYTYPEYIGEYANFEGGTDNQRDEEMQRLNDLKEELEGDQPSLEDEDVDMDLYNSINEKIEKIGEEIEALENLETEPAEVFEWWAVSSWLSEKLSNEGQVVTDAGSCHIWGRQTTGQAILLDYVITRICADMEILEGQRNDWSKH